MTMTIFVLVSAASFAIISVCALMDVGDNRRSEDFHTIQHFYANHS